MPRHRRHGGLPWARVRLMEPGSRFPTAGSPGSQPGGRTPRRSPHTRPDRLLPREPEPGWRRDRGHLASGSGCRSIWPLASTDQKGAGATARRQAAVPQSAPPARGPRRADAGRYRVGGGARNPRDGPARWSRSNRPRLLFPSTDRGAPRKQRRTLCHGQGSRVAPPFETPALPGRTRLVRAARQPDTRPELGCGARHDR